MRSRLRFPPIGDAKAYGPLGNRLPIVLSPISVIVLEHKLVRILVRKILLRPTRDFGSDEPIEYPERVIGNLRDGYIGERFEHGRGIDIGSPREGPAVSAVSPMSVDRSDLRRSNPGL